MLRTKKFRYYSIRMGIGWLGTTIHHSRHILTIVWMMAASIYPELLKFILQRIQWIWCGVAMDFCHFHSMAIPSLGFT